MKIKENELLNEVLSQGVNRYERANETLAKEKLFSVEVWDSKNKLWFDYDCPKDDTVEDYIDWCVGEQSDIWVTVNGPYDKIRLNGEYVIDGLDYFTFTLKK